MNEYIGHETQLCGVEEHRLIGGKGDGIRLLEVNNGNGIMFTLSLDRAGDIARLYKDGRNLGFFAPCGYVAPTYYDKEGRVFEIIYCRIFNNLRSYSGWKPMRG